MKTLGRQTEAEAAYRTAIRCGPRDANVLNNLEILFFLTQARILAARGKGRRAAVALERARAVARDAERQRYDLKLLRLREQLAAAAERR